MLYLFFSSLLAGFLINLILSPVGCIVIWQKMNNMGDSLAHSFIFAIILSKILYINNNLAIISLAIIFGFMIYLLTKTDNKNNIILIISNGLVASSIIILDMVGNNINLESILFGDILSINKQDLVTILIFAIITLIWLFNYYKSIVIMSINEDLALSLGLKTRWIKLSFILLASCVIALAIKVIGTLLVSSLLLIPATIARNFSKDPKQMIIAATIIGSLIILTGISLSFAFNFSTGPLIASIAFCAFFLSHLYTYKISKVNF